MNLTDTHTHLYLDEFKSDIDAVMQRAKDAGVTKFYLPAIDSSETENLLLLEEKYPGECFVMMGLHPCSVKENYKEELKHVEEWLVKKSFVAIGEIGLDFYWDKTFTQQQYEAFEMQAQWALEKHLPVVVHTRNAMKETISFLKPFAAKGLKGIVHCFSGTYDDAREIIGMNFLLGIGGVLTYKKAGLAEVIEKIDLQYLVLETDSPYLAPVPFRGKRNESSYVKFVAEKLALIKNVTIEVVANITSTNAENLFGK